MLQPLTEKHSTAVWQIEQQAYRFPWSFTQVQQQLSSHHMNFGLWQDDALVGFILLHNIFPEAEVLNIAVAPLWQNKKIARSLLLHAFDALATKNFARIYLEVRASNHVAIHLYEALGFNQIGERKNYYPAGKNNREDALLYGKELCY
jgi:[ribosomal protein S18]-alanine N-acetyltransferase